VLDTPSAKAAAAKTHPFQLSLGTKRGIELLIHACRAARGRHYLIGRNDFANGFNSLSRQAMLQTHAELFPEAVDVFNLFYACLSSTTRESWSHSQAKKALGRGVRLVQKLFV